MSEVNTAHIKKVAVLLGGNSNEREISIATGKNVVSALNELGYQVFEIEVNRDISDIIQQLIKINPDVVFNALHGGSGENGEIQALLNMLKIKYTHSNVLASSIGMNKIFTHYIADSFEITMPKCQVLTIEEVKNKQFGKYPIVIKKHDDGSTVGIKVIHSDEEKKNLQWTWNYNNVLVEEFIKGREFTVGVLSGSALTITEIIYESEIFSYEAKYQPGIARHVLDPDLPLHIEQRLKNYAVKIHDILGCSGVTRSDFIYDGNEIYFLEINTQPGLTRNSFIPEQAQFIGLSFNQLVQCLIEQAGHDEA